MLGFGCQVSGVGSKGKRNDNQELDPLEKTLGHKVAEHQRHRQVDKKSSFIRESIFQCSALSSWALTPDTWNLKPESRNKNETIIKCMCVYMNGNFHHPRSFSIIEKIPASKRSDCPYLLYSIQGVGTPLRSISPRGLQPIRSGTRSVL